MKTTTRTLRELKGQRPIVALTAYDFTTARLASEAGVDLILVGDSLGTTVLGYETTVPVTLEMMLHHTAAVARAGPDGLVVMDIPFPEAHRDVGRLLDACARGLQEGGAGAVKIEGGAAMADRIARIVAAGIPVLGHVGLLPQQIHQLGGYRKFGKTPGEREALLADARAVEGTGAFGLVVEMVDPECTREISEALKIPVIGIGAGSHCDGQVLVSHDLLGLTAGKTPSFVRRYAEAGKVIGDAFKRYAADVRNGNFP